MQSSITHIKTKRFALKIISLYKHLVSVKSEHVLAKQLLRSGTSIGANVRESYSAQSKADFINKLYIALKEANETAYWLELLYESGIIDDALFNDNYNDLKEILALLTSSIKTAKDNK